MHASLDALTLDARRSSSPAMARGILAEAQDLLRNALDHRESERALAFWFSRILQEVAASPAVEELLEGARLRFTGAVARSDALPTDEVSWLLEGDSGAAGDQVRQLFSGAGLRVGESGEPASATEWADRAAAAAATGDASRIAVYVDAGLLTESGLAEHLIAPSLHHLPPALRLTEGLPDHSAPADVRGMLLEPVVAVARWAGLLAGVAAGDVPGRLSGARDGGVLTDDEAQALLQAWDTGLSLELRRWRHDAWAEGAPLRSLPALDRSAYGAAARLVSVALRSVAGRHGINVD